MSDPSERSTISPAKLDAIRSLFADLPSDFQERQRYVQHVRQSFHEELATAFEGPFNTFASGLPHDSKETKERNVSMLNGMLRSVGLTIRDPKTLRPAILVVDTQDSDHPEVSRYRLETRDEQGRAKRTLAARHAIPTLTLMPDHPRREFWARKSRERGETCR